MHQPQVVGQLWSEGFYSVFLKTSACMEHLSLALSCPNIW